MSNLQDLINLAKADGGKFFVMDEEGNANLVIMSVEDYQNLLLGKLQRQVADVEDINREIMQAQLEPEASAILKVEPLKPVTQSPIIGHYKPQDLRAEVIDPSFDFEGPKVEIDDL
jgi:hypothetical protein